MNAIFAVNRVGAFGTGDDLPWPKSTVDFKRFARLTKGSTVVMGSRTWGSNMPKPLPGRRNIVLSSSLVDDRCEVYGSIIDLMMNLRQDEPVWVIGGAVILWKLRYSIDTVHLSVFKDCTPSTITLDLERYLDGFKKVEDEECGDHRYEVWTKVKKWNNTTT